METCEVSTLEPHEPIQVRKCPSPKGESSIIPMSPCHVGIGSFGIMNGHFIHANPLKGTGVSIYLRERHCFSLVCTFQKAIMNFGVKEEGALKFREKKT
jgi:hypothetical protein